ncbi:MAG TPA: L-seryl-tRNA(Sec) selenium transferase [Gemmatimonadaceae bacterium]|nr:L-seryl-tRNA(Sec) selenium transferase [Gemmatimonadaceae bacterium]
MTRGSHDARRALPSVSSLLETAEVQSLIDRHPRALVVDAIRDAIAAARDSGTALSHSDWHSRISEALVRRQTRSLVGVINATGVVLHTNLGRAPLAAAAVEAIREIASGYTNLEYDLTEGTRGSRYVHCVSLLRELTGAEDAIVVNNCAAALILALSALARGREVVISRGELVEIGGSFRVPDIMGRSGAALVEVGTTNRTHVDDYVRAIGPNTGLIAKVHQSNFAQTGFVASVDVRALKSIAAEHDIPILHDLGSGLLVDLANYGLSGEPTAAAALDAGATIVLMSGDKLLGGPQCGIALGSRNAIARMRKDPFARAMRVDKLAIAALTATLELYRDEERAVSEIPTLAMLTASPESVRERCETVASSIARSGITATVRESDASVGAGAFPALAIPSYAVTIAGDAQAIEKRLRAHTTPVISRIQDDAIMLDLRSVLPSQDGELADCIRVALS